MLSVRNEQMYKKMVYMTDRIRNDDVAHALDMVSLWLVQISL